MMTAVDTDRVVVELTSNEIGYTITAACRQFVGAWMVPQSALHPPVDPRKSIPGV